MKPAETEVSEGVGRVRRENDLPDLGVRILADFGRIVSAEARLLESNVVGAAQALLDRAYLSLILVVIAAAGVVSIIASIILLLHKWMPWWQVLGIVGLASIAIASVLRRVFMPPDVPAFQVSSPRNN